MILSVLEERLLAALQEVHTSDVSLAAGPSPGPGPEQTELVNISAQKLFILSLPFGEEAGDLRSPAFFSHTHRWSANGNIKDFKLPEEIKGEVTEVESPSGHPIKVGDDYELQGRILKFYKPPAKGNKAVAATLRGQPAQGYQDKLPCEVSITLTTWAEKINRADELLSKSLSALLAACVDLGNIEDQALEDSKVRLRLLQPVASLTGIERTGKKTVDSFYNQAEARLLIRGEFEVTVARGELEPEGIIKHIEYSVTPTGKHPPRTFLSHKLSAPISIRPIKSRSVADIDGIGERFSSQLAMTLSSSKLAPESITLAELSRINPDKMNIDISLHRLWEFRTKAEIILGFECPPDLPQPLLNMSLSMIVDTKCDELAATFTTYPTSLSERIIEKLKVNLRMLQVLLTDRAFREIKLKYLS